MPFVKLRLLVGVGALCSAMAGCSPSTTSPTTSTSTTTPTAPYTLNGKVLQAGTSNGIASAAVTLTAAASAPLTTSTDASGAFSFSGLTTSGTYTLQIVAVGYVPATITIAIPVAATFTVNLPLATPPQPIPVLTVTGQASLGARGQTSQLTAIVTNPDGSTANVTTVAKWSSSNPAVAGVSSSGLVTALSAGVSTISASMPEESGSLSVTVTF